MSLARLFPVQSLLAAALLWSAAARGDDALQPSRLPPVDESQPWLTPVAAESASEDHEELQSGLSKEKREALESAVLEGPDTEPAWYGWLVPSVWRIPADWDSSLELGIDGSEGNSTTLTLRSGANLRRQVESSDLKIALTYVKSTAEQVETKHNAQLDANHDWLLGDSPWSIFLKSILVYDEFRPFDLELTLNAGLGYRFIHTDTLNLKGRFGSGATRQWDGPDDRWRPEAMLGVDFEYEISERQKFRVTSEYFPEWGDFEAYRIRTDAGYQVLLSEASNMSLKLGVIDRYDSQDGGTKPHALDYALLLLWKL